VTRESPESEGTVIHAPSSHRVRLWVLLLLFSLLAAGMVLRHEMWRDEIRAWQAVVDADSPSELADSVSSEGHPGLCYALLFPLSRVTSDPPAMQLLRLTRASPVVHPLTVEKATDANRILDVLAAPWRGDMLIPVIRHRFWNSNILDTVVGGDAMQALLGIVLVGVFAGLFARHLPSLLLYVIGTVGFDRFLVSLVRRPRATSRTPPAVADRLSLDLAGVI
jgi:hypothetical protein